MRLDVIAEFLALASQWVALISGVTLCALLAYSILNPGFKFWPAGPKSGWRHAVAFTLFRAFCGAVVLYAIAVTLLAGGGKWWNWVLGLPMMGAAYGVTLWGYRSLGLGNTYCEAEGLITHGLYACTRNPQYVSSVLATVGLAITAGSWVVLMQAGLLFLIYLLFALNEERWLKEGYGQAFLDYMRDVPRFLDMRSLQRAPAELIRRPSGG